MATPVRVSHNRPEFVVADKVVCRTLHVEESTSGILGGPGGGNGNFDNLVVAVSTSLTGPVTVQGAIASNDDISCRNLTASQTVTANAVVANSLNVTSASIATVSGGPSFTGGATIAPAQTLTLTGATLAGGGTGALTGIATINTFPFPLPVRGGPTVDVANGLVFPTLTIPAGGSGTYRVTDASLAGMANTAANPGAGNGGIGGAGIPLINALAGDLTNRTELFVFNASSFVLGIDMTNITSRGWIWWPGTYVRISRSGLGGLVWVIETHALYYQSRLLGDNAVISPKVTLPGSVVMTRSEVAFSLHANSDVLANDVLCEFRGNVGFYVDRTAVPALDPVAITIRLPIGWAASAVWNALPEDGFLPSFGTLDLLEYYVAPTNGASPGVGVVGVGAVKEDPLAWVRVELDEGAGPGVLTVRAGNLGATGNLLTIYAPFRLIADRYTYTATF